MEKGRVQLWRFTRHEVHEILLVCNLAALSRTYFSRISMGLDAKQETLSIRSCNYNSKHRCKMSSNEQFENGRVHLLRRQMFFISIHGDVTIQ